MAKIIKSLKDLDDSKFELGDSINVSPLIIAMLPKYKRLSLDFFIDTSGYIDSNYYSDIKRVINRSELNTALSENPLFERIPIEFADSQERGVKFVHNGNITLALEYIKEVLYCMGFPRVDLTKEDRTLAESIGYNKLLVMALYTREKETAIKERLELLKKLKELDKILGSNNEVS